MISKGKQAVFPGGSTLRSIPPKSGEVVQKQWFTAHDTIMLNSINTTYHRYFQPADSKNSFMRRLDCKKNGVNRLLSGAKSRDSRHLAAHCQHASIVEGRAYDLESRRQLIAM
jgi:hypothetical protein